MSSVQTLEEKLVLPDYAEIPSTADLLKEAETAVQKKTVDPSSDPRNKLEYTFQFSHTDNQGQDWKGTFTHRIPTQDQLDQIDFIAARKKLGVPIEQWSMMAAERHFIHAHLQVCLVAKPKWAENLGALVDNAIVTKLYEEVASHEATFLGLKKNS